MLLLAIALTGCGAVPEKKASSDQPDWVSALPQRSGFVYGVGSADNTGSEARAVENARERARADLIGQMQVRISSQFTSETQLQMQEGVTTAFVEQVTNKVRSRIPEVELSDLRWTKSWVNPETGTHYALAELNRRAAEARLAEQLSTLDLELSEAELPAVVSKDAQIRSRLDRVREAMPVMALFAQRDRLYSQLSLVAESGVSRYRLSSDAQSLRVALRGLLAELTLAIHPTSSSDQDVVPLLSQSLTKAGFSVRSGKDPDADLHLYSHLKTSARRQNDLHYAFVFADNILRDERGKILHSFRHDARGVSGIKGRAEFLALEDLSEKVEKSLAEALFQ